MLRKFLKGKYAPLVELVKRRRLYKPKPSDAYLTDAKSIDYREIEITCLLDLTCKFEKREKYVVNAAAA